MCLIRLIFLSTILSHILLTYCSLPALAQLNLGGNNLFSNSGMNNPASTPNNFARPTFPIGDEPNKEQSNWLPATFPPFPTRYLSLPGLDDSEKEILSQNYFIVINDSNIKSFAQLYNENKLDNISSFVTTDSIVHPLFALQNNIRLKVIERTLSPSLESLLISMVHNTEIAYRDSEDAETKEEIKYNLAFLTVAIKLLIPDFPLPSNAGVRQLVSEELSNFKMAKLSRSVIFQRWEDFSFYQPVGFYKTSDAAGRFYSCYQWLAKSFLELSDTASGTMSGNGSAFRRAFLLFQSILNTKIQSKDLQKIDSGLVIWKQINKITQTLSISSNIEITNQDTYLLPEHLAQALDFAQASQIPVSSLSNPLIRARLLLPIRSYAPRQFSSTSIFSLARQGRTKEKQLKFHLVSPLYSPAQDISLPGPAFQPEDNTNFSYTPIALLLLRENGVNWANKILMQNSAKLNVQLINQLAEKQPNFDTAMHNSFWKLFGSFSNPWPNETQLFMQTEQWRTFCLERQVSAWIDNFLAIKTKSNLSTNSSQPKLENADSASDEQKTSSVMNKTNHDTNDTTRVTISSTIHKFGIGSWRTNSNFNYLEPALDLYNKLAESQSNLENALTQAGLFPSEYLDESRDFIRLLKRLASIAKSELDLELLKADDQALLASIDKLLEVVESPLPGKIFISFPTSKSKADNERSKILLPGVNMQIGYPATLFAIVQYKRTYYLLRGATYSYSEQSGEEINEKHRQRQVEYEFLPTPFWCQTFQRTNTKPN